MLISGLGQSAVVGILNLDDLATKERTLLILVFNMAAIILMTVWSKVWSDRASRVITYDRTSWFLHARRNQVLCTRVRNSRLARPK